MAAFLVTWFCKFVLPIKDGMLMRPGIFKIASKMVDGGRLTVPVLASICQGLGMIVASLDPAIGNIVFSGRYLYSSLAEYFLTHFYTSGNLNHPLMTQYQGEAKARQYNDSEAQALSKLRRSRVAPLGHEVAEARTHG
ncbi:hypothetical protein Vadar_023071 [Vaccinium darrowii]|uniref:Uncharacterized protein n=1 Tax=Vaccinium darrowii TaxID=229202 RepID=A0ACB7YYI7_9ERIC|nr:hypothetical protein Vadar_023071 [Vaccinium darrowii]